MYWFRARARSDKLEAANEAKFVFLLMFADSHLSKKFLRKTKGQQLQGKIVSEFSHFFTLFQSFAEFFPQDFPLQKRVLAQ